MWQINRKWIQFRENPKFDYGYLVLLVITFLKAHNRRVIPTIIYKMHFLLEIPRKIHTWTKVIYKWNNFEINKENIAMALNFEHT